MLSASFFTFDPPASKAVLKVLWKKWKEAVTNWKSRGLKNQDHRSGFPVSLLCNSGGAIQTDVRRAVKWARKVPSDFTDRVVVKIFRGLLQKGTTGAECAFLGKCAGCVICASTTEFFENFYNCEGWMGKVCTEGAGLMHMLTDPDWLIISNCLCPGISHWEAELGQVFLVLF